MLKPEFIEMIASMADPRFDHLAHDLTETPAEVSVRLNPRKRSSRSPVAAEAGEGKEVAWWPDGRYLPERPAFTFDPALHQGAYYVQEASSMVMAAVARRLSSLIAAEEAGKTQETAEAQEISEEEEADRGRPLLWLDACAAPGGKSTAALDGLPEGSLVVANEFDYSRAPVLAENIAKWGVPDTVVTRGDTARFRRVGEIFDVVAVDAPCSGEGMMRKDATAREQWSPGLVRECADRQREILANVWEALKPGGFLVYSTCTFNTLENEQTAAWLIEEYGALPVDTAIGCGIDGAVSLPGVAPLPALRFIPGRTRGEGLFLTVLRKPGILRARDFSAGASGAKEKKGKKQKGGADRPPAGAGEARAWLRADLAGEYPLSASESGLRAFPARWGALLPLFLRELQVISAGVEIAEVKGKDLIPTQQLALSALLDPGAFPCVGVDRAGALAYLARQGVELPPATPRGFVLLTFGGLPLGFVKNIGNRVNNLYPKEWRIKQLQQI